MSVEAISWALNRAPVDQSSVKSVLVGLANNAGSDGIGAFPSVSKLMQYTCLSKRTVQDALDVLEAAGIIAPCDPAIVAARIKRADHRPQGWDIDMSKTLGDGQSLAAFQAAYKKLQMRRKRQADASRARKKTKDAPTSENIDGGQPLTPVDPGPQIIRTGVNGDSNGGQPLRARGLMVARTGVNGCAPPYKEGTVLEPSVNRPERARAGAGEDDPPAATGDAKLAPLAPLDIDALDADIADELTQRTGLEITPAHCGWARSTLLAEMPAHAAGNPGLWARGQIRKMHDVRRLLSPDLSAALANRRQRALAERRPADNGKPKRSVKVPLPDGFAPTGAMLRWAAAEHPNVDLRLETAQFNSHHRSRATESASWPDEWQKWVRRADSFQRRPAAQPGPPAARGTTAAHQRSAEWDALIARMAAKDAGITTPTIPGEIIR